MREIKFRAWDRIKEVMVYTNENKQEDWWDGVYLTSVEMVNYRFEESRYDWLQYTGLKDQNGVEIYEGDIIHIVGEQELGLGSEYLLAWDDKAVVKWNEEECSYYLDLIRKYTVRFSDWEVAHKHTFELRKWDEEEWYIEYTVVGNIWEEKHD